MIRERIYQLDGLRAIAVILVVFYHLNIYIHAIPGFNLLIKNGGGLGVFLFFILSGYLMSMFYLGKNLSMHKLPSYKAFYLSRFIRIMPLYIISTTIFYVLRNNIETYGSSTFTISLIEFIGGLLFLNDKVFILNPVIWTLRIEIIFYFVFPLIGYIIHHLYLNKKHYILLLLPLILILLSTIFRYFQIFKTNSFFTNLDGLATGILAAIIISLITHNNIKINNKLLLFIIFIALICVGIVLHFHVFTYLYATSLSILFLLIFTGILLLPKENLLIKILSAPVLYYVALLSYSIYIWHFNIYYNICKPIMEQVVVSEYLQSTLSYVSAIIVTAVVSYISYHTIEKTFIKLKSKILKT